MRSAAGLSGQIRLHERNREPQQPQPQRVAARFVQQCDDVRLLGLTCP